ncbi:MAG: glycosyltransferase family 2 protein [Candidatus Nitrohelix vancouverensis]|uniref:Glycosyltransferase family 2 protein n=1 Tax=Candidatus Nitrohelix vancouverensis TaxID=2705534 RepID=A0A7T0G4B5_9BACT|nr:MAG: glycosyltransferase family 2 protein [Candidatus Nitrohelix vancouverensis]
MAESQNKQAPEVSIIVPTYNRKNFLKDCLSSIINQTFRNYEVFVVDDGSSDGTETLTSDFPQVRFIFLQENGGVSRARNIGVQAARGAYICFLDSDDLWLENKLEVQMEWMRKHPEAMAVHTDEIWIRRGRRVNPMSKHAKHGGDIFERCLPFCIVSPSSILLKKELFDRVGGFDESLPACEDYDLWLRIAAQFRIELIDEKLMIKRGGHADQLSHKHWGMDRFRVRSLLNLLESGNLNPSQRSLTIGELAEKCRILALGCDKRGKVQDAEKYRTIMNKYLEKSEAETSDIHAH